MDLIRSHKLIVATIVIQIIALPLILMVVKTRQTTTTKASAASTLYFTPQTTSGSPVSKNVNEDVSLDLMINPGTNLVSLAKLDISYDATKFSVADASKVVVNTTAFPVTVEGPVLSNGRVQIVVSVGSDQTKVIQTPTKILTLTLKATAPANSTQVGFGNNNSLLSIAPSDSPSENVLSTTTPAFIKINSAPTSTPTPTNSPTATPTRTPSPTPTPDDLFFIQNSQPGNEFIFTTSTGTSVPSSALISGQTYRVSFQPGLQNIVKTSTIDSRLVTVTLQRNGTVLDSTDSFYSLISNHRDGAGFEELTGTFVAGSTNLFEAIIDKANTIPETNENNNKIAQTVSGAAPTSTPAPTTPPNSPTPGSTVINFNGIKLHGLGKGGDTPNPGSAGTLSPLRPTRDLIVELYNSSGTLVNTSTGNLKYTNSTQGVFNGTVTLPSSIAAGNYLVKIKSSYYLRKNVPGFLDLKVGQQNTVNSLELVAGDTDNDNKLESTDDYDIIMDCYSDLLGPANCNATKKLAADISDDGKVDQDDYNLFLRELSVQQGD